MKTRYTTLLGALLFLLPSLLLYSCGETEDLPATEEAAQELKIAQELVRIVVGSNAEVGIEKGNSDYQAFSLNEEIAAVVLTGDKLMIDAVSMGQTSVIVSDGSGQYRSLTVISYFDEIVLEREALHIHVPYGNVKTDRIAIIKGNGEYTVESSDPDLVTAEVAGDELLLSAANEGSATITLTDRFGISATIPVTIVVSHTPYDTYELEEIKNLANLCYMFNNTLTENATTYYTILNKIENEKHLYGWDYYNYYYLKIYFSGDKEVGKKENASLNYRYSSTTFSVPSLDLEVIKNDGEKIWVVYSFIQNERLYYGYFVQKINP